MGLAFKHFFNHTKLSLSQENENKSQTHSSICARTLVMLVNKEQFLRGPWWNQIFRSGLQWFQRQRQNSLGAQNSNSNLGFTPPSTRATVVFSGPSLLDHTRPCNWPSPEGTRRTRGTHCSKILHCFHYEKTSRKSQPLKRANVGVIISIVNRFF